MKRWITAALFTFMVGCGSSLAFWEGLAVDATKFTCQELSKDWQDEPDVVKFACQGIQMTGTTPTTAQVIIRVPGHQADLFRSRYVRPAASVPSASSARPASR